MRPKRLLIVDDSPTILLSISAILAKAGYAVRQAATGAAAVSLLAEEPFDAVLVDLQMPAMDGIELIRQVRASADHRFTPIVVLTTETRRARREQAREAGATAWLTKPVAPTELVDALKHVTPGHA